MVAKGLEFPIAPSPWLVEASKLAVLESALSLLELVEFIIPPRLASG